MRKLIIKILGRILSDYFLNVLYTREEKIQIIYSVSLKYLRSEDEALKIVHALKNVNSYKLFNKSAEMMRERMLNKAHYAVFELHKN